MTTLPATNDAGMAVPFSPSHVQTTSPVATGVVPPSPMAVTRIVDKSRAAVTAADRYRRSGVQLEPVADTELTPSAATMRRQSQISGELQAPSSGRQSRSDSMLLGNGDPEMDALVAQLVSMADYDDPTTRGL